MAEFEAMVSLDVQNSRMKDFHDIWALSNAFGFEGRSLRQAIATCLERRGTGWDGEAPRALTPAFYQRSEIASRWRNYLGAGAVLVAPPAQFEVIGEQIIGFLGPMTGSILSNDSFEQYWPPGSPCVMETLPHHRS